MKSPALRFAVFAILLAFAVDVRAQNLGSSESSEHLIKAGYVYNFAKLVEWPPSAVPRGQPIVIGVLGNDDFAAVLSRVVEGKRIDDRPFEVRRLKTKELRDCGCRILFVAASESARTDEIIQFQNSASVLTIAEAPDFARRGGIIALTLEDSKVRFAVNVDAAAQASLTISSRLLTLATIVHTAR
jgi:hypothetical protein